MGQKHTQKYCKACQENVLAVKKEPNHILHLILTILTSGMWLIVWLLVSIFQDSWRCSKCKKRLQLYNQFIFIIFI